MKNYYTKVKLSDLKTLTKCRDAIERIEGECENVVGGMKAWMSGCRTELKTGAKNKIAAIERKMAKL